ncbi:hypothetical protein K469DRAFT_562264 [Zopfia rhizophila CBS 207.26]|uniref:Uncharacterized protein n=1 Tax=Zopfia rhizophila CBS 207.26 TaxID=1314779 RepID=A0A6A6EFJ9_9PEZI|nr:hypothetical protein K469DRAFT_562264 [Zopfia rhizophila CBS 207.26]
MFTRLTNSTTPSSNIKASISALSQSPPPPNSCPKKKGKGVKNKYPLHIYQCSPRPPGKEKNELKTYNSGYSLVVTHLTTNPPVTGLSTRERTGPSVFMHLWSYVGWVSKFFHIYPCLE